MGHQNSNVSLVYISSSDHEKLQGTYFINPIDSFSIHSNVCAQKSLKRTCRTVFFLFFLHPDRAMKHTGEIALFLAINIARLTDSTINYYGLCVFLFKVFMPASSG